MRGTDPLVERELAAVEDALATGRTGGPDRELRELALLLRADAPEPDPAFARRLGRRVREGFARSTRRRRLATRPAAALAAAGVAAAGIAIAISLPGGDGSGPSDKTSGVEAARGDRGSGPAAALPAPERGELSLGHRRAVARSASLTLAAPKDELDRTADGIAAVADRHRGYVLRSSVTTGEDGGGSFELRIPEQELQPALSDLGRLGDVRSSTQAGDDITRRTAVTSDRLRMDRAQRAALLRRLERAVSNAEVEAIRDRLGLVNREIAGLRRELRGLRRRADFATLNVALVPEAERRDTGVGAALDDFIDSLEGSVVVALRVLGVALPVGVLALLAAVTFRLARRRRRAAALLL
jgi:hypothetical protein